MTRGRVTMYAPRAFGLAFALALLACVPLRASEAPQAVGNFGPTGLEISIQPDQTLKILDVQPGSPAEGKLRKGDIVTEINGTPPVQPEKDPHVIFSNFKQLASFITQAEATNGALNFKLKPAGGGDARAVTVTIPVLGSYSDTWPMNCPKTDKIIRAHADTIATVAGEDGAGLTAHTMTNGFALLMLLSTGEEKDLEVVKKVYKTRMASFDPASVGHHNWNNGLQGIAACEYYLRTGDKTVMPLINEICRMIAKYQVHGGWSHWAKGINPQYTAGGLMNAAGTQNLTTLLLAKQCGAAVEYDALMDALRFFYRFAGHGSTPYGDHRPESGYASTNGKSEMVALAMGVAARAENGEVYVMARDKNALRALYSYPYILRGHTGGNGAKWHGIAAALMAEKKPKLYRNQLEEKKWFFELSRRHTGAFGATGTGRYDQVPHGYFTGVTLTAPRKTLQITGAPPSPHAESFRLPFRPWGRRADLAFFNIEGGPAYKGSDEPPHVEMNQIPEADRATLRSLASHPEQGYREAAADAIRDQQMFSLIEELLESDDPMAQQTGCKALNHLGPWTLRFAIGTRSKESVAPEHFTPRMFKALMKIITDANSAWWSVDQAMHALVLATPEQIQPHLDDLLPWLEHEEWMLRESATLALTPAMKDEASMKKLLPILIDSMATNLHIKGRGIQGWALSQGTKDASPAIRKMVAKVPFELAEKFPPYWNADPEVDLTGIASVAVYHSLWASIRNEKWQIIDDAEQIFKTAKTSLDRLDELRSRERSKLLEILIEAGNNLKGEDRTKMGRFLQKHFRGLLIGDDPAAFAETMANGDALKQVDQLLAIDTMAGAPGGWELLGRDTEGKTTWYHTSFEPETKPHKSAQHRYRPVDLPERLKGWHETDYNPAENGWTREHASPYEGETPDQYPVAGKWFADHIKEAGEVIFVHKTFDLDDLDYAHMRIRIHTRQGFEVFLNGHRIHETKGRAKTWGNRGIYVNDNINKHLRVGRNVIAVRSFLQYFRGLDGGVDVFVEKLEALPDVE